MGELGVSLAGWLRGMGVSVVGRLDNNWCKQAHGEGVARADVLKQELRCVHLATARVGEQGVHGAGLVLRRRAE